MPAPHAKFGSFHELLKTPGLLKRWAGNLHRQSLPKWLSKPYRFTGVGAVLRGGRWNGQKLIPAVYASLDRDTLHQEVNARAHRYGWTEEDLKPGLLISLHYQLQAVLDLTDHAVLETLKVRSKELTDCDWEADQMAGRESLTQGIARAAFEHLAEGLLVPSAQNPKGGKNMVLFPTHLRTGSTVETLHETDIPFSHGL